nr:helix-turn-helix domain-containing protein [Marisediminicola senii]
MVLAKQRNAYKGRAPSLSPFQATELCRKADAGVPKAVLAREFGISRETVYAYLRTRTNEADAATALVEKTVEGLPADTRPVPTLTQYDTLLATPPAREH